jgi:hypothetical protein
MTLQNFTHDEVAALYAQHTADTRQPLYRSKTITLTGL